VAYRNNRIIQWAITIILGFIVIAGLSWVNYLFSNNNPGGNDFLIQYEGTRALLFDGNSPYSDEVESRIQIAAYGHSAQGNEQRLRFSYPLYSVILFAPFSLFKNHIIARSVWMTVLELSLIGMTFISFRLVEWTPPLWLQALMAPGIDFIVFFNLVSCYPRSRKWKRSHSGRSADFGHFSVN